MPDADDIVLNLKMGLDAPALARRFVAQHAAGLAPNVTGDAELLVSELVTNAVVHGQSDIVLRISLHPPGVGVAVYDQNTEVPVTASGLPDVTQPSGRGLLIVQALASTWGVAASTSPPGKTVWFDLSPE